MTKLLIIVFFLNCYTYLYCQKHDYNWVMGYDFNDSTLTKVAGVQFDFYSKPVFIYKQKRKMKFYWVNTVISDSIGNLLLYSNGCEISNSFDEIISNGQNINPGSAHNLKCKDGEPYTSGSQSMMTIPKPGVANNIYFVFHEGIKYVEQPVVDVLTDKLYLSEIDMSKNNGHGEVIIKNKPIMVDSLTSGEITAVKHANGNDWWIIVPQDRNNGYWSFLITEQGVTDTIESYLGDATNPYGNGAGQAVFSPDGKKYIRFNTQNMVRMFDFDRITGKFSNYQKINIDLLGFNVNLGGCAVSSNSRFLYVTTLKYIFQLDLQTTDIEKSVVLLDEWDGTAQPWLPATFYQCQLAPDCKIYINAPNGVDVMHVVNKPNEKGLACDLVQHGIKLPALNGITIPNFPNYRQGQEGQDYQVCDSTVQVFTPFFEPKNLEVFPNPTNSSLFLKTTKINSPFKIYDVLGNQVMSGILKNETTELDISELEKGVYFVYLNDRIRPIKVVVMRE